MGFLYACALALLIFSNPIINAESQPPIGFQGTRGRRSISTLDDEVKNENYSNIYQNIESVSTTSTPDEFNDGGGGGGSHIAYEPTLTFVKRAPSGFFGMRGKKDYEYTEFQAPDKKFLLNYPIRYVPKRAPSGFMGMRGKKLLHDDYYSDKRAPSGFMGMRGKKDSEENYNIADQQNSINSNIDMFENLESERNFLNDFGKFYNSHHADFNSDDHESNEKRAPSQGFMGMRGKKFFEDDIDGINDLKRAPAAGFFGMRGKKWSDFDDFQSDQLKRAPMGFQGMRGKKDVSDVLSGNLDGIGQKRAPAPGFFGMRGKKHPMFYSNQGSGFFGMRGKKQPFEFRGKFVGVRGKKIPKGSLVHYSSDLSDLTELASDSLIDSDMSSNKRGPSGFVGMRGKKWSDSSNSSD